MKILFIVPDLVVGGVTSVVLNIIRGLQKNNVDVKLVSLFDRCDVCVDGIDHQTLGIKSFLDIPSSIKAMRKIIHSFNPNIVHSHTMYSHLLIFVCSYISKDYKLIVSDHGTYTSTLRFYKRMFLFKMMNSKADLVTNVSDVSCESYVVQNIVSQCKIITMYNGVDTERFKYSVENRNIIRKDLKISGQTKVIGFVGRISKEKNIPNLINAVSLLQLDYKLLILGDGPELDNIKKIIKEKKMNNSVVFLGESKNPSKYYSAFDLLVLSSDTEGLPTVVLEAIASNCLVVSTNCGGVKEIFPYGYEYISPLSDHVALSRLIFKILSLSCLEKEKIKKNNYNYILGKFSLSKVNQEWWRVYSES